MTQFQIAKYKHFATFLTKRAGLDLVTVDPLDDYVETICPKCKRINVFGEKEFGNLCCSKCRAHEQKNWYLKRSQELVEAAGFELSNTIYEEDYIEVKCPECDNVSSFSFKELPSIHCKFCLMEKIAWSKGFQMYSAESLPPELVQGELYDDGLYCVCLQCNRFRVLNRYDENIINHVKKLKCPCNTIPKLKRIAISRGFSLEQTSSPFGFYSLKQNEIALICNRCGEEIILNLYDKNLINKIKTVTCKNADCISEPDYITLTRCGDMAWCCDTLRVISILNFTHFNCHLIGNECHLQIPENDKCEVYFASDSSNRDYALALVVYPEEEDEWRSKYLLFRLKVETWGFSRISAVYMIKPPSFCSELYATIKNDISTYFMRPISVARDTIDAYINMYNKIHNLNRKYWNLENILPILNMQETLLKLNVPTPKIKYPYDPRLHQYLKLHVCPVCGKFYASTEKTCLHCVFPELDHIFTNMDNEEDWDTNVLLPAKQRYNAYFTASFKSQQSDRMKEILKEHPEIMLKISKAILDNIEVRINSIKKELKQL